MNIPSDNIEQNKTIEIKIEEQHKTIKKLANYEMIKIIGEGTFGKVKLAKNIPTGELVAIKILEKSKIEDNDDLKCVTREIKFLKELNHINLISLYEIIETGRNYYIIMEYAENELFSYIVSNNYLSEEISSFFYIQILSSIEYIHLHKIVHRDLKPENILLTCNNNLIKIIDFGLANKYNDNELLKTACGSPCYAAPEMILGKKYNGIDVDIWSSGVVLFAMVCGYLPFEDDDNESIYRKVVIGKYDIPQRISKNCKDLIQKILEVNPKKRIKIEDIKNHPFLKDAYFKYNNEFKDIFINNLNGDEVEIYDNIIDKMMEMKIKKVECKDDIINNLKENHFNNITTIYKLLVKQSRRNNIKLIKKNSSNLKSKSSNEGVPSSSSSKTCASNNNSHSGKKIKILKNDDKYNFTSIKNNPNENKLILNKNNNILIDDTLKIHSFSLEVHRTVLNKLNNKKNNNSLNQKENKKKKEGGNFIKNYRKFINNIKKTISNRNRRNMIDTSLSIEHNSNINYTITTTNFNDSSSSNSNLTKIHNMKLSFIPSNTINLMEINKDVNSKSKSKGKNSPSKTNKKKPLTIITQSPLLLENKININLKSKGNNQTLSKDNNKSSFHKRAISGIASPIHSVTNKNENKIYHNSHLNNKKIYSNRNTENNNVNKSKGKISNVTNQNNNNSQKQKNINEKNNKVLITTFINLSNNTKSKSPLNIKSQKNNLINHKIKNKQNNFTSAHHTTNNFFKSNINNLNINHQTKSRESSSSSSKKNSHQMNSLSNLHSKRNNILLTMNSNRNDFACCSTNLNFEDIFKKCKELCKEHNYIFKSIDNYHAYINCNDNSISIEISKVTNKNIVKMFHMNGNEKITKEIIKNIIVEIGF